MDCSESKFYGSSSDYAMTAPSYLDRQPPPPFGGDGVRKGGTYVYIPPQPSTTQTSSICVRCGGMCGGMCRFKITSSTPSRSSSKLGMKFGAMLMILISIIFIVAGSSLSWRSMSSWWCRSKCCGTCGSSAPSGCSCTSTSNPDGCCVDTSVSTAGYTFLIAGILMLIASIVWFFMC